MPSIKRKSPDDDETLDKLHDDHDDAGQHELKEEQHSHGQEHVTIDEDAVEAVMGDETADLNMEDAGDILQDAVHAVTHAPPDPSTTTTVAAATATTTPPPSVMGEHTEQLEQLDDDNHHHHEDDEEVIDGHDGDFKRTAVGGDAQWNAMLFQLIFYKAVHGDLRPKAKDDEHKPLYDWMVAQRKEFKIYQETPEKSYLTADQVKVLDHLQFPWNTRGDEHWIRNFEHLKQFRKEHGHCMVPRTFIDVPNLCHWVTDQRRQLKNLKSGKPSTMTKDRQRLLDEVGFVWQVRNRTTWDIRFAELIEFKAQKGSTVVPQHYTPNRALGKWVAKQREQHRALKRGEHSFLTPDRLEQLNNVGFVWSMKGRTPKEEDDASTAAIEDAAVAAAKAAVAAAVEAEEAEAERRQHQEEDVAAAVAEAAMEADEEEDEDMGHPDDDEGIVTTSV